MINAPTSVVIRHTSGSKECEVEEFRLEQFRELVVGRDPSCGIRYHPEREDLVSRQHARIGRDPADPQAFIITDLKSRNGTIVNHERILGTCRLQHGDLVQLGPGGPEFRFELDPPPVVATRPIRAVDSLAPQTRPVTRVPAGVGSGRHSREGGNPFAVSPRNLRGLGPHPDIGQMQAVGGELVKRPLGGLKARLWGESSKARTLGILGLATVFALGVGALWRYQRTQRAEAAKLRQDLLAKQSEIKRNADSLNQLQEALNASQTEAENLRAETQPPPSPDPKLTAKLADKERVIEQMRNEAEQKDQVIKQMKNDAEQKEEVNKELSDKVAQLSPHLSSAQPQNAAEPPVAAGPTDKKVDRAHTVRVKAGTELRVRLSDNITLPSTKDGQSGTFTGTLDKALRAENHTIADKGSPVEGSFESAKDDKGRAGLRLTLLRIQTVTGSMLPVEAGPGKEPSNRLLKGGALVGAVVTTVAVPASRPVTTGVSRAVLQGSSQKGATSVTAIRAGTKVEFKLNRDLDFVLP